MGFEIVVGDNTYIVKLSNEPSWVIGLQSGDAISVVGEGVYLVVAFSVWSIPDREAAYRAIEIARLRTELVRVCLLPYDGPEEIEAWLPGEAERPGAVVGISKTRGGAQVSISQKEEASPVWLVVQNGKTIEIRQGPLRDNEIVRLLSLIVDLTDT